MPERGNVTTISVRKSIRDELLIYKEFGMSWDNLFERIIYLFKSSITKNQSQD